MIANNRVLLDREDAPFLARYYLSIVGSGYVRCTQLGAKNRGKSEYLHRLIVSAPLGVEVDHINRNKLDNRRNNLRLVNRAQNALNITAKNYWYNKKRNRYITEFLIGGKRERKWFRREEDALNYASTRRAEILSQLPRTTKQVKK